MALHVNTISKQSHFNQCLPAKR